MTAEIVIAAAMGTHADVDVDEDGRDVNVSIDAICSLRLYRFGFGCIMIEFFRLDQKNFKFVFESSFFSVVRVDRVANGGKSRLFVFVSQRHKWKFNVVCKVEEQWGDDCEVLTET